MISKICIVGPTGVGKSSIVSRIGGTSLLSQVNAGSTFTSCDAFVGEKTITLEISDVSGEDRLRCMGPIYYKGTQAAICVFDLTSTKSFQALTLWIESIRNYANEECIIVIVGNKADLEHQRQVSEDLAVRYARLEGAEYFEVSALVGTGLVDLLVSVAKQLLRFSDCSLSYAAKRSIISSHIEHTGIDSKKRERRLSDSLKKVPLLNYWTNEKPISLYN